MQTDGDTKRPKPDSAPVRLERQSEQFRAWARAGHLKHAMPAEFQGYGNSFAELVASHRQLGKTSLNCGLVLAINAHLWGWVYPLLTFGATEQKTRWLEGSLDGSLIGGHAITEADAGSDLGGLKCTAIQHGDHFVLNGRKRLITNAPLADFLVVYAKFDGKLSAFIVASDDRGVNRAAASGLTACRGAATGDLHLDDCRIPKDRLLGKIGAGGLLIQQALEMERAFVFAGICGIMQWQLETVIEHSRKRMVQGAHLGKNQAISHKIADMQLRLDTLGLWVAECARLKDAKRRISLAAAQTKLFGGEAFLQSSLDAVQILGGSGLLAESRLPELVNDAMASRLFSGSSEIQKNIIAALLGTGDGYRLQAGQETDE